MKTKAVIVSICITVLLFFCNTAYCQYSNSGASEVMPKYSWKNPLDAGMKNLRNNDFYAYKLKFDDYIQYSPAAIMLICKASGVKGRDKWGRMLAADAFSAAIMAGLVNGVKYSAKRLRPDGSRRNSFPSGHTATAFCLAQMLHKEYGWKYPWISFGGYSIASVTAASRIFNNRHWLTDILAGSLIGIASTELGYLINDAIFKNRLVEDGYSPEEFFYDTSIRQHDIEHFYGYRLGLGKNGVSGGYMAVQASLGLHPRWKARMRVALSGFGDRYNLYSTLVGASFNLPLAKRLEAEATALVGPAFRSKNCPEQYREYIRNCNASLDAGIALNLILSNNFKMKLLLENETIFTRSHASSSLIFGFGGSFYY